MTRRSKTSAKSTLPAYPEAAAGSVLPDWAKVDRKSVKTRAPKCTPARTGVRNPDPAKAQLLTIDQAAGRLAVSAKTIRRMIEDGRLKAVRMGRAVRVSEASIAAFCRGGN